MREQILNMKKNSIIELYRFAAVLIIMAYHIGNTGIGTDNPFMAGWTYVEFFLFLSGYLTAKHFDGKINESAGKAAVTYSIAKFKTLYILAAIVTTLAYTTVNILTMLNGGGISGFISGYLGDFIPELFMVTEIYSHPLVAPLWYLAAIIVIFPFFCLLLQMKDKYKMMIISVIIAVAYYGFTSFQVVRDFPFDYLRVLAGLCVGAALYCAADMAEGAHFKTNKVIINIALIFALLFPVIGEALNKENSKVYLICHLLAVVLAFNGKSFASSYNNKIMDYAGSISMPLFVIHWYIGSLVNILGQFIALSSAAKAVIYYAVSIGAAMAACHIIAGIKHANTAE